MIISAEEISAIHDRQIERFGGMSGIRDAGALDAAINSPYQGYGGIELYPSIEEKATRLAYEIVAQHPYVDGSKRTGAVVLVASMRKCGYRFKPRHDELYNAIMGIADASLDYGNLLEFVRASIRQSEQ